ncbi:MAG: glycosyltransferase family 2 protein [Novosphingobium sp.]
MNRSDDPELSIIVVNWNTRDMTIACLESLLRETQSTSFEVLLIDNGSHDGSADAIAARFPQVRLLRESVNHGFAKANNIAAEAARGSRLLLLNSDTVVLDRAVDRLADFAGRTPQARIWGGRTVYGDGSLNIGSAWGRQTVWSAFCFASGLSLLLSRFSLFDPEAMRGWDRGSEREVDIVSGCFLMIDRSLWDELGGFDQDFFMYAEEADLCLRAKARGARPRVSPEATIVHYGGASATSNSQAVRRVLRAKVALARKHMGPLSARTVHLLFVFAAALRRGAYALLSAVTGKGGEQAKVWDAVWRDRRTWTAPAAPAGVSAAGRQAG